MYKVIDVQWIQILYPASQGHATSKWDNDYETDFLNAENSAQLRRQTSGNPYEWTSYFSCSPGHISNLLCKLIIICKKEIVKEAAWFHLLKWKRWDY